MAFSIYFHPFTVNLAITYYKPTRLRDKFLSDFCVAGCLDEDETTGEMKTDLKKFRVFSFACVNFMVCLAWHLLATLGFGCSAI